MDQLLLIAIVLIVVGIVLTIVGELMKPRTGVDTEQSIWTLIVTALGFLINGFTQLRDGPSTGHRIQGLGSISFGLGFIVLLVYLAKEIFPGLKDIFSPGGSPSPDAGSPSPSSS